MTAPEVMNTLFRNFLLGVTFVIRIPVEFYDKRKDRQVLSSN